MCQEQECHGSTQAEGVGTNLNRVESQGSFTNGFSRAGSELGSDSGRCCKGLNPITKETGESKSDQQTVKTTVRSRT